MKRKVPNLSKVNDSDLWRELWAREGYHPVLVSISKQVVRTEFNGELKLAIMSIGDPKMFPESERTILKTEIIERFQI